MVRLRSACLLTLTLPCVSKIQKLLDAQSKVSEPPQAPPEEQQEQAIQTSAHSEPLKMSVSIAVGTGALSDFSQSRAFYYILYSIKSAQRV